jgi:hypothetical protein
MLCAQALACSGAVVEDFPIRFDHGFLGRLRVVISSGCLGSGCVGAGLGECEPLVAEVGDDL